MPEIVGIILIGVLLCVFGGLWRTNRLNDGNPGEAPDSADRLPQPPRS
jgi:hypothetical protein